jgi:DNA invertase Pin-like site-specific DNA recombinase
MKGAGCDLYLDRQAVDTTTPGGRAMFGMLGVFAEFERSIIQDRIHAGMARARLRGTKSGKAIGRPTISPAKEDAIRSALAQGGKGILKIADELGVGSGTVQRVRAEMRAAGN